MNERNSKTSKATMRLMLMGGLAVAVTAGCGDDDASAQEKYCEAGASLEASVEGLLGLDLIAEGTGGLESALGEIGTSVTDLRETATDAAADDVDALQQAVDGLDGALSELGAEISSENVAGVQSAVQGIGAAVQGVLATLSDC